jgi:hypothetical protein
MSYKYEMHCHTKTVSQCGRVEPKEIARLYKEKGYSGIVMTDHYSPLTFYNKNYLAPQKCIDFYLSAYHEMKKYESDDFTVMLGLELRHYATANDYLIYGVDEDWLKHQGNMMAWWEKKMYENMHKQGYIVYQAHPFRPGMIRCNPDYIDGVEIYNGKTDKEANDKAYEWAKKNGKLMISGSDFHVLGNLARGGIITEKPIRNNDDLLDTLRAQNFEMIKTY